jgi:hypothetical protein
MRWEEADQLNAQVQVANSRRNTDILRAVFEVAVRDHFDPGVDVREISAFVRGMRQSYGMFVPVLETEMLIREALGESVPTDNIDLIPEQAAKHLVLYALADAWDRDLGRLNAVLVGGERLAAQRHERSPVIEPPGLLPSAGLVGAESVTAVREYHELRLMPVRDREGWLRERHPHGPRPEWWLSLARAAEEEGSSPLYGGRSASWRIFELAGWALQTGLERGELDDVRACYWALRLAVLAVKLGKPARDLPEMLTAEGAARRSLTALSATPGGSSVSNPTADRAADLRLVLPQLAALRPAVANPQLSGQIRDLLVAHPMEAAAE